MRTGGKFVLATIGAATLLGALAEPAEARRRIRFGGWGSSNSSSGYAEKIDKVYDLPDTGTYFNDGKYYDLGAFYQIRDGAEVYPTEPSFVLYNGDRYVKLGGAELTMLTVELGMDPTATYRANYAAKIPARSKSANEIERREGETTEQFRARVRGMAHARGTGSAEIPAVAPARGGGIGMLFLPMLLIGALFVLGLRKFLRRRVATVLASGAEPVEEVNAASFDQRIAARLRELEGGQDQKAMAPAIPAPRTFGRKLA
ncbi:hypothetical protein [Sphingomonas psychrotolerans]|uniref:Uncharacterized protein n=1 Tax=Sphingomonas psychrotolerans TaxID=1327635 RepID=A0A2K8MF48_9SPHN|nr:hypothetical protein [Sphingomonas psychrotolerans]ATY32512.1 hypothetical protein CVN68_11450 [Sphingomonas psychrotolerans]